MQVHDTNLADVKLLAPRVFADSRGFFLESYNQRTFALIRDPRDAARLRQRGDPGPLRYQGFPCSTIRSQSERIP